ADGQSCGQSSDCASHICKEETCVASSCTDGVRNAGETDIDCGGDACQGCANGKNCRQDRDCGSGVCRAGTCADPACTDGVRNGNETGVDCGGPRCEVCEHGGRCQKNSDCRSGVCDTNTCRAPTCNDQTRNGDETGVDCGGTRCGSCAVGEACRQGADCESSVCKSGQCASPTCSDRTQNGTETDADCGGKDCHPCDVGGTCNDGSDCTTGVCSGNRCASPSCSDGVQNGDESDVDCGGSCAACSVGSQCRFAEDCTSGVCQNSTCQSPDCHDRVQNGHETDVDCGGSDCGGCANGASCSVDSDCASNLCVSGQCVECKNGKTRTVRKACGYKLRGNRVDQICKNHQWQRDRCLGVWYADCEEILDDDPNAPSGSYSVDPDGPANTTYSSFQVHCDMKTSGGGWTLVALEEPESEESPQSKLAYLGYEYGQPSDLLNDETAIIGVRFQGRYDDVRIAWGGTDDALDTDYNKYIQFTIPDSDGELFERDAGAQGSGTAVDLEPLKSFSTSVSSLSSEVSNAGGATFRRASEYPDEQPGDTRWGVVPLDDNHDGCGANSGGWTGRGAYYSGTDTTDTITGNANDYCGDQGPGSFVGYKSDNEDKAHPTNYNTRIWIR
ncbi:MAG: fibrinogen-like YCDxxxxGGGW domain-containing protein, partial [Bradymonadaceae bacterium]